MDDNESEQTEASNNKASLNPLQVIGSVFAAGLGVQSSKNRERDFKQGNIGIFVAVGIVFTLLFVVCVVAVVQVVITSAAT